MAQTYEITSYEYGIMFFGGFFFVILTTYAFNSVSQINRHDSCGFGVVHHRYALENDLTLWTKLLYFFFILLLLI